MSAMERQYGKAGEAQTKKKLKLSVGAGAWDVNLRTNDKGCLVLRKQRLQNLYVGGWAGSVVAFNNSSLSVFDSGKIEVRQSWNAGNKMSFGMSLVLEAGTYTVHSSDDDAHKVTLILDKAEGQSFNFREGEPRDRLNTLGLEEYRALFELYSIWQSVTTVEIRIPDKRTLNQWDTRIVEECLSAATARVSVSRPATLASSHSTPEAQTAATTNAPHIVADTTAAGGVSLQRTKYSTVSNDQSLTMGTEEMERENLVARSESWSVEQRARMEDWRLARQRKSAERRARWEGQRNFWGLDDRQWQVAFRLWESAVVDEN